MRAQDLRIGNILQYFIGEEGCEWDSTVIDWQDLKWATEENENFNKVHKPIPLTEDWIKRLHFDQLDKSYYAKNAGDFRLSFYYCYSASAWKFEVENTRLEIKYVHQLQNLYFALTGEELTLTDQG